MRVLVYADARGEDWCDLLVRHGFEAVLLEPDKLPTAMDAEVCVVINLAARALAGYRAWIAQLKAPILLITTAMGAAQAWQRKTRAANLICRPSDALGDLSELVAMTRTIRQGLLVRDPDTATGAIFQRADI